MAGKADIEAARAYVTLLLKDQGFSKGLAAAGQSLKSVGKGISIFGAAVAGAGAVITGPMLAAVHSVTEAGAAMKLMSQRTGQSVEALSALRFAAEQSGGTIEDVEKAILISAKKGFDPKRFQEYAAGLAAIEDPGKRAEKAFAMFGRGAGAILPMLARLPELMQEAKENGLIMSDSTAAAALKLHNSWNLLGRVIGGVKSAIGGALIPIMQSAAEWQIRIAKSVRDWVRQNKELFVSIFKIGVVLTGVGTAIVALGGFVALAGSALIGLNTMLGVAVSVLGALVSPLGLIVAGLSGLAYWFATSTQWGRQMVQSLIGWFGDLKDVAIESFKGIADALAGGNLKLAAEIAMAGVKVAWLQGTKGLRAIWGEFKDYAVRTFIEVGFEIESAWARSIATIRKAWVEFSRWWQDAWDVIVNALAKLGQTDSIKSELDKQLYEKVYAREKASKVDAKSIEAERDAALEKYGKARDQAQQAQNKQSSEEADRAQKALADAQARLASLRDTAATERKDRELKNPAAFNPGNAGLDPTKIQDRTFATFSASAAIAGARGGSPGVAELKDIQKAARKAEGVRQQILIAAQEQRRALLKLGLLK